MSRSPPPSQFGDHPPPRVAAPKNFTLTQCPSPSCDNSPIVTGMCVVRACGHLATFCSHPRWFPGNTSPRGVRQRARGASAGIAAPSLQHGGELQIALLRSKVRHLRSPFWVARSACSAAAFGRSPLPAPLRLISIHGPYSAERTGCQRSSFSVSYSQSVSGSGPVGRG